MTRAEAERFEAILPEIMKGTGGRINLQPTREQIVQDEKWLNILDAMAKCKARQTVTRGIVEELFKNEQNAREKSWSSVLILVPSEVALKEAWNAVKDLTGPKGKRRATKDIRKFTERVKSLSSEEATILVLPGGAAQGFIGWTTQI